MKTDTETGSAAEMAPGEQKITDNVITRRQVIITYQLQPEEGSKISSRFLEPREADQSADV